MRLLRTLGLAAGLAVPMLPAGVAHANEADLSRAEELRQMVERGTRFEHAEGLQRDLAHAHALYCRAARENSPDALVRLGWMYANGRGVPRDDSTAHTLFRRAGTLGSELAQRLASVVKGPDERLPDCLITRAPAPEPDPKPLDIPPPAQSSEPAQPTPVVVAPAAFRAGPNTPEFKQWLASVLKMAVDFKLDPRLVFALIRAESNFDPMAKSPKNAQGLMQLIPETAERFAVRDVWDPLENIRGGMSYLRWLLSHFKGDVVLALAGYNAGEGAVDRHKGVPPYPETLAYVQRIRALYPMDKHPFDPKAASPIRSAKIPSSPAPTGKLQ